MTKFNHEPYRHYPRSTFAGETAFYLKWQEIADVTVEHVTKNNHITDRETRLIASFLTWLGTSCGNSFLFNAELTAKEVSSLGNGFLYAWADENRRVKWINSGQRTLEGIAGEEFELTVYDYEIIDLVVEWLATTQGQDFIRDANARISACQQKIDLLESLMR